MMSRRVITLAYISSFLLAAGIAAYCMYVGSHLPAGAALRGIAGIDSLPKTQQSVTLPTGSPLAVFLLQIASIIIVSQGCTFLFRKIGQPAVMGEIIAGIVLGPSLMGILMPGFSAFLFPASSLGNLHMLSEVGLILFMFVIGLELDPALVTREMSSAAMISYFGIVVPFTLGLVLSYFLYGRFAGPGSTFGSFALFTGIAMSITAFPVLARIIRERALSGSRLGTVALTAAAIGDVAAWCLLAVIVAIARPGVTGSPVYTIAAAAGFVMIMWMVVKPMLAAYLPGTYHDRSLRRPALALLFVLLLGSAYCCEVIGIHALFGAFLAGAIMPHDSGFRNLLIAKIEDVALVLLLPLFFVFTGLRTNIGSLDGGTDWLYCLLIIIVAIVGKFGGSVLAARICGERLRDSLCIGALMNTRGLVELVVLNIGFDLGILSTKLFTMLVIMALATTFMTSPILSAFSRMEGGRD